MPRIPDKRIGRFTLYKEVSFYEHRLWEVEQLLERQHDDMVKNMFAEQQAFDEENKWRQLARTARFRWLSCAASVGGAKANATYCAKVKQSAKA